MFEDDASGEHSDHEVGDRAHAPDVEDHARRRGPLRDHDPCRLGHALRRGGAMWRSPSSVTRPPSPMPSPPRRADVRDQHPGPGRRAGPLGPGLRPGARPRRGHTARRGAGRARGRPGHRRCDAVQERARHGGLRGLRCDRRPASAGARPLPTCSAVASPRGRTRSWSGGWPPTGSASEIGDGPTTRGPDGPVTMTVTGAAVIPGVSMAAPPNRATASNRRPGSGSTWRTNAVGNGPGPGRRWPRLIPIDRRSSRSSSPTRTCRPSSCPTTTTVVPATIAARTAIP